jgi:hypothetical protein
MGFLSRRFGASRGAGPPKWAQAPASARTASMAARLSLYPGGEPLEVVDASDHQDELWSIVGGIRGDFVRVAAIALLIPEKDDPNDPGAIHVVISGLRVARLSHEDAATYRPGLLRLIRTSTNGLVALEGEIFRGASRSGGSGLLEVSLLHDPLDFGVKPRPRPAEITEWRTDDRMG